MQHSKSSSLICLKVTPDLLLDQGPEMSSEEDQRAMQAIYSILREG